MSNKTIDIKLIKSSIGRLPNHKKCVKGLGFRKLQQTVTVEDTPSNRRNNPPPGANPLKKISLNLKLCDLSLVLK